ncbi:hypothetical protein BGZ46_009409 [Entomortierella lignicola]|nr:hypothetical protein BGZ46_009409 [Entomortierella lignicola]
MDNSSDSSDLYCLYGEEILAEPVSVLFGSQSLQFPLNPDDFPKVSELLECCIPSAFGMNERSVIDNSYRNCKELRPKNFTLSNSYHEILPKIVTQTAIVLESPKPIYASLNKLCVYETHGFFKKHVDTPQTNIFASLVICLPTNHEGGNLIVKESSYDLSSSNSIKWCAFYSDCEHSIDEVTKGYRMTLTYDLLYLDTPELVPYHDDLYQKLEQSLLKLYEENMVDPDNCSTRWPKFVIGIPLASKYPSLTRGSGPILKGKDLKTVSILRDLGYTTDIKAVFGVSAEKINPKSTPFEGVGSVYEEEELSEEFLKEYENEEVFVITDVWGGFDRCNEQYGDSPFSALYKAGGRSLKNLVWLEKPQCRQAGVEYTAYGNEPSTGVVYMDGCILAYK